LNTKTFTANGTYTDIFRVNKTTDVALELWGTWDSATFTLTRTSRTGGTGGTYHTVKVATDPTDPLTGAAFTVSGDLLTVLTLPPGTYGWTVASSSGSTSVSFDAGGKAKGGVASGASGGGP
jgi:hypothetical protein